MRQDFLYSADLRLDNHNSQTDRGEVPFKAGVAMAPSIWSAPSSGKTSSVEAIPGREIQITAHVHLHEITVDLVRL